MLRRPLRPARLGPALLAVALGAGTPACTYDYLAAFEGSGGSVSTSSSSSGSGAAGGGGGQGGSTPVSECPGARPGDPGPWLQVMGSKEAPERTHAVVVDEQGAVYVGGNIAGDHEQGIFAGTQGDSTSDAFVAKLSASGELVWRKRFGTLSSTDGVLDMATHAGVLLVSGTSGDGIVIDPAEPPIRGGWLATLETSDGSTRWARALGEPTEHYPQAVAFGPTGDVIVGGRFKGTLALGLTSQLTATSAPDDLDAYIAVLEPTGEARAAKWIQSDEIDRISDLTTDSDGFIYASGTLGKSGATICSLHPTVEDGDALAVKLDPDAGCEGGWSNAIGGPLLQMGLSIAVPDSNHVYLGGNFTGILRQNEDVYAQTPAGTTDGFVMRLAAHDGTGSIPTAFGAVGADADDSSSCLAPTPDGVLATGFFSKGAHFYENTGAQALGGAGGTDLFALTLDLGASPVGFQRYGDAGDQWDPPGANQMRVVAVPRGMILAGSLRGTATFDGMKAESAGDSDAWVARLCLPPPL
jgi:hypothetical protein